MSSQKPESRRNEKRIYSMDEVAACYLRLDAAAKLNALSNASREDMRTAVDALGRIIDRNARGCA